MNGEGHRHRPLAQPAAELIAASRAYEEVVRKFHDVPDYLDLMRKMLREFSTVPMDIIGTRPYPHTMELFPELVLNLCQGSAASIALARNIIRTLPKSDVERRVVGELDALVAGMNADEVAQLADLLIEFRLSAAVQRVAAYAASQPDDEMRELADELNGVEHDESRWGLSREERIRRRG